MGVAAYNRGSDALKKQIDLEHPVKNSDTPLAWTDERARLNARIAELENNLIRSKRCIKVQSIQLTIERQAATEAKERSRTERMEWFHALVAERRRTAWLSKLIRRFLSPAQVQAFREE